MASVQLSIGSSAAQTGRTPQQARRKACRSLFGPVDREELNRELDAELSEISERDQERWNFNFASCTPLHGDYEWERAEVDAAPGFYQESVQAERKRAAPLPHADAPNGGNSARGGAASGAVAPARTRPGKPGSTKRTTTTRITDFYVKRKKRGGELKQRESAPPNPLRFLSSEQTPRKGLR